jgi:hypothetical protein
MTDQTSAVSTRRLTRAGASATALAAAARTALTAAGPGADSATFSVNGQQFSAVLDQALLTISSIPGRRMALVTTIPTRFPGGQLKQLPDDSRHGAPLGRRVWRNT